MVCSFNNFINGLIKYYKLIDLYGTQASFKVDKKDYFKTNMGSFLTILTILISFSSFIYFFLMFFDDKSPRLLFSIKNIFDPPLTNLNLDNYGFGFSLQDPFTYDQFIDETIYHPLVFQMTGTRVQRGNASIFEWSAIPMDLVNCNINKFPKDYHKIMKDLPFNDYYCLKEPSFNLAGTFLFSQYSYLMIKLFECKNSTDIIENGGISDKRNLKRFLKEGNEELDYFDFSDFSDLSDFSDKNYLKDKYFGKLIFKLF